MSVIISMNLELRGRIKMDITKKLTDEELKDFTQRVVVQLEPSLTQKALSLLLELGRYRSLIKEGLLLEAPCKRATYAYRPMMLFGKPTVQKVWIYSLTLGPVGWRIGCASSSGKAFYYYSEKDIGKKIFLTEEEAKEKL